MDRSSCRAWRQASTRVKTGTGTVGEAAAGTQEMPWQLPGHTLPAIAAASIASRLLSHHHARHTSRGSCRSCCLAYHPSSSLGPGAGPPPSAATRPIHLQRLYSRQMTQVMSRVKKRILIRKPCHTCKYRLYIGLTLFCQSGQ